VYNHKEWARDFDGHRTGLFPDVRFPETPAPVDIAPERRHRYDRLDRD
jgi:hypothetical protein